MRISYGFGSLALVLGCVVAPACKSELPVDDPSDNPAVLGPRGIIRGTVTYVGPGPCIKNGQVEGAMVFLAFDAANPPPPDGLASTALNFATVPGERLFYNVPRPATGPGSTKEPNTSYCPPIDAPPITASADWTLTQMAAGRYQVRAFYSRQNRFNPLFNFANLPLAGDVAGGVLADPRDPVPRFGVVEVGVPITVDPARCPDPAKDDAFCKQRRADAAAGKLEIPELGFLREGVSAIVGRTLLSNRPFFHIDYAGSTSFEVLTDTVAAAKDFGADWLAQRKMLAGDEVRALGMIAFPQDHLSTSQTNQLEGTNVCLVNKDPSCDLFKFAQASFPQIKFRFGLPGKDGKTSPGNDLFLAKLAKPSDPFSAERVRPFYGIDPWEFVESTTAPIPTSGSFFLTRNFNAEGKPEILRDNKSLEDTAKIAELFPSVVLAKLAEDGEGNILQPPRSQTDPVVVIQTITLRNWPGTEQGSMKATSEGEVAGGGLTDASGAAPDPSHPLASRSGFELTDTFTALVRPSVVCIHPQVDLRGTLVTPVKSDPNPENIGVPLVEPANIFRTRGNRVKDINFGCLPPGHYAVNVVYPTGQAWSFPNLSGHCSYDARFRPNEECMVPFADPNLHLGQAQPGLKELPGFPAVGPFDPAKGFPLRPLLASQMLYQTNPDGTLKTFTDVNGAVRPLPQVVEVRPSPRCGSYQIETDATCGADAECGPHAYAGVCMAGPAGKKYCDLNADGKINVNAQGQGVRVWVNNPVNEDTAFADDESSPKNANGLLDDGEDVNANGKLDLRVPNVCSLPLAKWTGLIDPKQQVK